MEFVATLTFSEARQMVLSTVRGALPALKVENVPLESAAGRVLAEAICADRDTPALSRSVRDGFAVRSIDLPGNLEVIGEVRAGQRFSGFVGPGHAVEIMTGAPVPEGADAVVMVEHTRRDVDRSQRRSAPVHQPARMRSDRR
jgi:molybdopterin molybdotransferase